MEWKQNFYEELIQKLDQFIRKFYVNKLIRGGLYFVGAMTLIFVLFNVLENHFYFNKIVRKFLFVSYLITGAATFYTWILSPLMHYFRLGKLISHEEAAKIIGVHFSNVQDKLLNVLQLKSQSVNYTDRSLIDASIQQKANELQPVPFLSAIDYNINKKYLRFALIPMSLLFGILLIAPGLIKDSTKRIIQNDKEFEKEALFSFNLVNKDLLVPQGEDYKLLIDIKGSVLPNEAYIEIDQLQYRLKKESPSRFSYVLSNIQKETNFKLVSGDIQSGIYQLKVAENPVLTHLQAKLDYPDYTGIKDEVIANSGDLNIPAGTKILWTFEAIHTSGMYCSFSNGNKQDLTRKGENSYQFSYRPLNDESYTLFLKNNYFDQFDSVNYQLSVIPDQFPQIDVQTYEDSLNNSLIYLSGDANDDYGLSNLSLNYQVIHADGKAQSNQAVKINISEGKSTTFRYVLDLDQIGMNSGDRISYFFEVWDNDAVHGPKSTKSSIVENKLASKEELEKQEEKNNEEIKDNLEDAFKEAQKLQEKIDAFRDKIREKKDLEWQNKKDLEKLIDQQNELLKQFENAKQKFNENLKKQEQFSNPDERLLQKQEQLQKLFNESMNNEIKDLMDKIQQLMQDLKKDKALEMTEKMRNNSEDFKKEMDRLKDLFKQLEVEKNLKDQIEKLRDLAARQDELKEKTEKKELSSEELKKLQEEINKKFEELKKNQEDIQKKNAELERPNKLSDQKKNTEETKKSLDKAKEKLSKNDKESAPKDQKEGAEKMKKMADEMEKEMESSDKEQQEEDIKALRQLLENLVSLSFEQEALTNDFVKTDIQAPKFVSLTKEESRLKNNFKLIQDTLEALSKRVIEMESFVSEKVSEINSNFNTAIDLLENRSAQEASVNQGRIMKNLNDLAVLLSETMNQKQKQCNSSCNKPGNKSCKKPGKSNKPGKNGKVPSDKIAQGQQKLTEEMKKMHEQIQGGQKGGSSKDFAEMAAKQGQLRKMLEDLQKEKKEQGNGSQDLQKAIEEMNKNEKELVNKQLDNETLRRTQDITTRLLESDRAEREREYKEERKSETGTKIERKFPASLEEYLKKRQAEVEWYQQVSPDLRPFYKRLVENYFQGMKKQG